MKRMAWVMAIMLAAGCGQAAPGEDATQGDFEPWLEAEIGRKDGKLVLEWDTNLDLDHENYGGPNVEGQGHAHFFFGAGNTPLRTKEPYEIRDLKPGTYTMRVYLVENDHSPIGVEKTFEIVVPQQ